MTASVLGCVLGGAAVLCSHPVPLMLLVITWAALGLLFAMVCSDQGNRPRAVVRSPVVGGLIGLLLVGVGQLGVLGLVLAAVLLILLFPFGASTDEGPER
jgi:hypothetical protein